MRAARDPPLGPEPRAAVAEIARVLEPGGTFCGTTFLSPKLPFGDDATQQAVDAALRELQEAVAGRVGGPRGEASRGDGCILFTFVTPWGR